MESKDQKSKRRAMDNVAHHGEYSEKMIEAYLCNQVRLRGGIPLKYSNHSAAGYPDRVLLMPGGVTLWVELKSKGRKPRTLQRLRIKKMAALGHMVFVVDSKEKADDIMKPFKLAEKYEV